VWGADEFPTTRTIDMHVLKLRKKLEVDPETPKLIQTVHGVGYRFDPAGGATTKGDGPAR
jgi:DNA-binding response OmpR family regulator